MSSPTRLCLAAVFGALLAAPAHAGFITVNNAGFENPPLAQNGLTIDSVPMWTIGPPIGTATVGIYDPGPIHYTSANAPEGENVLYINGGRSVSQTLSDTVQANTTYQLSVLVGNRNDVGVNVTYGGYKVELLAGGVPLALDVNSVVVTKDTFQLITVTYTTSSSETAIGQAIGIRLSTINPGNLSHMNFDKVELSAEPAGGTNPVPAPPGVVLVGLGVACLGLTRRFHRSA